MVIAAMQAGAEVDLEDARAKFREALLDPFPRREVRSLEDSELREAVGLSA